MTSHKFLNFLTSLFPFYSSYALRIILNLHFWMPLPPPIMWHHLCMTLRRKTMAEIVWGFLARFSPILFKRSFQFLVRITGQFHCNCTTWGIHNIHNKLQDPSFTITSQYTTQIYNETMTLLLWQKCCNFDFTSTYHHTLQIVVILTAG